LNVDEIAELLKTRATRKEMDYEDYEFGYLLNLESTVSQLVRNNICPNEQKAYIYQASRHYRQLPAL